MNTLLILDEINTNGFKTGALDVIFLFAILFGISTIVSKNPILSLLFLIALFGAVSSYLILTGLTFLGLSYLIVYIGAISMLFLFILMLINIRVSELQSNTKDSIPLALFIAILFFNNIFIALPYNKQMLDDSFNHLLSRVYLNIFENNSNNLSFALSNGWDEFLTETTHISGIGNVLYTNYNIWLLMSSFILLLAMVGAIIITLKK